MRFISNAVLSCEYVLSRPLFIPAETEAVQVVGAIEPGKDPGPWMKTESER